MIMDMRTAIIVRKDLPVGQIANVSAIVMAEVARAVPSVLAAQPVNDLNDCRHAAPRFSVVVLRANGSEQLGHFAVAMTMERPQLFVVGFSEVGQGFHNAFDLYRARIMELSTEATRLVAVAISGDEVAIRRATKRFSVL